MSAQTTIDDRTADVIRSAIGGCAGRPHRRKRARSVSAALAEGGDPAALECDDRRIPLPHAGEFELRDSAILRRGASARPRDPLIVRNFATALVGAERIRGDVRAPDRRRIAATIGPCASRLRGFAAQMSGDLRCSHRGL